MRNAYSILSVVILPGSLLLAQDWQPGPTAPAGLVGRTYAGMAYDANRNRVVLFGGETGTAWLNDTWETSGGMWTAGPTAPPALTGRSQLGMCFDAARGVVVIFGGVNNGTLNNETWFYDGNAWTQGPSAPAALTPRRAIGLTFDPVRAQCVLFGGFGAASATSDTWLLDSAWTQGPAAPPAMTARGSYGMAFDGLGGQTVLFGGYTSGNAALGDTWLWDGAAWSAGPAAPPALTPRYSCSMASAATVAGGSSAIVLFGGFDGVPNRLNETWTFFQGTWTQRPGPPPALTARAGAAVTAPGTVQIGVLLLGGDDGTVPLNDVWKDTCVLPMFSGSATNVFYLWTGKTASGNFFAGGGLPPYTFQVATGALPPGVTLGSSTGSISGVPGQAGDYPVGIVVQDANGCIGAIEVEYVVSQTPDSVVGGGPGPTNPNSVRIFDAVNTQVNEFFPYGAGAFGTNVAAAAIDPAFLTTDFRDEMVSGPGPGPVLGPQVRAFASTGNPLAKVNYFAYGTLKFGVNVASGDVDADGMSEILTGPGPGGVFGPQVRGWNYDGTAITAIGKINYFAYGTLKYGVKDGGGRLDVDDYEEIATGPGPGFIFGPQVRGWNYDGTAISAISKINFNAFTVLQYGVNISMADYDLDGYEELACSPGPGSTSSFPSQFVGFNYDGSAVAAMLAFDATPFTTFYGGRPGAGALSADSREDLLAAPGPDPAAAATIQKLDYTGTALVSFDTFTAFGTNYGANPAGASLGF
ncbi:MAG: Ig domain-containing protein [Acidobacteriota bacterium]